MRKIELELESLAVEPFETADGRAASRGTVRAASEPEPLSEAPFECIDSEFTGPCCEYTLVLSCVQTGCDECFWTPGL